MKVFFTLAALVAASLSPASAAPCPKDTSICTVPLITDDSAPLPQAEAKEPEPAEPAPIAVAPAAAPAPMPVVTAPAVPTVAPAPPAPRPTPPPAPAMALGIAEILDWQLRDYWILSTDESPVQQQRIRGRCERASLTARFIVNSNGYTDDVRVLRNTALNPFFERRIETLIRDRYYTPAPTNPRRQSVSVEETFRLSC